MATVRITESLCSDVTYAARRLFEKRIEAASQFFGDEAEIFDAIIEALVETHDPDRHWEKTPDGWNAKSTMLSISSINGFKPSYKTSLERLPSPVPAMYAFGRYTTGNAVVVDHPSLQEIADKWASWEAHRAELVAEQAATVKHAELFLSRHSTLRQALAEWPGLWELLPEEAKRRHNEPTTRASTKAPTTAFDTSQLTKAVVVSKIVES